jgi:hypothetical protein
VTYRVLFDGEALVQLNGLPAEAFEALFARVVELVDAPWDARVMPGSDDPAYRQAVFGAGSGLVNFQVDEDAESIRIFNLVWIG